MAMKILSIDWDYYIDASADERELFPDGHDFASVSLANSCWASHYGNPLCSKDLKKIGVSSDYKDICEFFRNLMSAPNKFMISISHLDAYEFINEQVKGNKSFEITNIDFHHDMYPLDADYENVRRMTKTECSRNGKEVHCGNWLTAILDDRRNATVRWVARSDSDIAFSMADERYKDRAKIISHGEAMNDKYDVIFICRSDIWSCPHLDKEFDDLCQISIDKGYEILYNHALYESRWKNVKREAKMHEEAFSSFMNEKKK